MHPVRRPLLLLQSLRWRAGLNWIVRQLDPPRDPERIVAMEGVRGLAILLVFLVHFSTLFQRHTPPGSITFHLAAAFVSFGQIGVDLFFILSGYLLYGILMSRPVGYLRFLRRRCQRIFPPFLAILAIQILAGFLVPGYSKLPASPAAAAGYIALNALLLPGLFDIRPIVTVAWSLSYEIAFYLLLPALISLAGLRDWNSNRRGYLFLVLSCIYLIACSLWPGYEVRGIHLGPFSHPRLVLFAAGMLAWEIVRSWQALPAWTRRLELAVALSLAGLVLLSVSGPSTLSPALAGVVRTALVFLWAGALAVCVYGCRGQFATWFSWAPLRWLGNLSYSFYLAHSLGLVAVMLLLRTLWPALAPSSWLVIVLLPVAFAASSGVSFLLFVLIEKPYSLPSRRAARQLSPLISG